MEAQGQYVREVTIGNRLGFHVRPIQRFAQLARAFRGDVQVSVGDRTASGKSVMGLMGLGGQCGSVMRIQTSGVDARQAAELLGYLVANQFFVEEAEADAPPERHLDRLAGFASCFDGDIAVERDGKKANARDRAALAELGLTPDGDDVVIHAAGADGEQARAVLDAVLKCRFYVETPGNTAQGKAD